MQDEIAVATRTLLEADAKKGFAASRKSAPQICLIVHADAGERKTTYVIIAPAAPVLTWTDDKFGGQGGNAPN